MRPATRSTIWLLARVRGLWLHLTRRYAAKSHALGAASRPCRVRFAWFRRRGKAFDDLDDLVSAEPVALYLKRLDDVDHDALRELIDRSARIHKGLDRAPT
jgi:hypothetical protein